ncbi:mannosyltransferase family protein [Actinomadura fulvescens]|uniref:Glycosyltransferase family 39 protein n=1 Tax=Actinomadura fulvescens TaxID=46160 RepID=A0ABP6BL79_9ACTN
MVLHGSRETRLDVFRHEPDLDLDGYRPLPEHVETEADRRSRIGFGDALPALALYAVVRAVGVYVLWAWGASRDKALVDLLGRSWDSNWFLAIAQSGYDYGDTERSNLAFFPLYPLLLKGTDTVLPLDGAEAGILVAWLAALAAAWGLFAVGTHVHDRRTGIMLAVLWGVIPHGITQSMAYTEGLFTALAAWALYAVLARQWLVAGVLCLVAGLSRPTASALIGAVCLAALVALIRRRDGWRPAFALLVGPLGWLAYLAWVGQRVGRPDAWFQIQGEQWGTTFDGGFYTFNKAREVLSRASELENYVVTFVLLVAVALFVMSLIDRQPWPLLVYSALMLITSLGGENYYHSKARYIVPAFALLLPAAVGLSRAHLGKAVVTLTTVCLVSAFMGGYLLLVWKHSP